jgi:pyruvate dehydrogenase complex dehydrogenase (E1) component
MFRQIGIYSSKGQLYTPQDSDQLMYYREDKKGQILEEGINEAGSFCSWLAAGTSYSNHDLPTVPFYIYYSMFGFQRMAIHLGRWRSAVPRIPDRRNGDRTTHWRANCSTRMATT